MARTKRHADERCRWKVDEDGIYQTDCGNDFCFTDDGPVENKMKFCCYCGCVLKADPVNYRSAMRPVGGGLDG